jgi:hypothetical protein
MEQAGGQLREDIQRGNRGQQLAAAVPAAAVVAAASKSSIRSRGAPSQKTAFQP